MTSSAWLATQQDEYMLGKKIMHHAIAADNLPVKTGVDVFNELGGRQLLRYVDVYSVHEPRGGRVGQPTWVTPTPLSADEVDHYLDLPAPEKSRTHVVRLDPRLIPAIAGPQWVGLGMGIQYLLPYGYSTDAVLFPGWAHEVR
jgi:hypothetical protein